MKAAGITLSTVGAGGGSNPFLQGLARDGGGRFYNAADVAGLPEDVKYSGRGVTTIEERELWHMPIVLFTMLALLSGEWFYRRRVGLA